MKRKTMHAMAVWTAFAVSTIGIMPILSTGSEINGFHNESETQEADLSAGLANLKTAVEQANQAFGKIYDAYDQKKQRKLSAEDAASDVLDIMDEAGDMAEEVSSMEIPSSLSDMVSSLSSFWSVDIFSACDYGYDAIMDGGEQEEEDFLDAMAAAQSDLLSIAENINNTASEYGLGDQYVLIEKRIDEPETETVEEKTEVTSPTEKETILADTEPQSKSVFIYPDKTETETNESETILPQRNTFTAQTKRETDPYTKKSESEKETPAKTETVSEVNSTQPETIPFRNDTSTVSVEKETDVHIAESEAERKPKETETDNKADASEAEAIPVQNNISIAARDEETNLNISELETKNETETETAWSEIQSEPVSKLTRETETYIQSELFGQTESEKPGEQVSEPVSEIESETEALSERESETEALLTGKAEPASKTYERMLMEIQSEIAAYYERESESETSLTESTEIESETDNHQETESESVLASEIETQKAGELTVILEWPDNSSKVKPSSVTITPVVNGVKSEEAKDAAERNGWMLKWNDIGTSAVVTVSAGKTEGWSFLAGQAHTDTSGNRIIVIHGYPENETEFEQIETETEYATDYDEADTGNSDTEASTKEENAAIQAAAHSLAALFGGEGGLLYAAAIAMGLLILAITIAIFVSVGKM